MLTYFCFTLFVYITSTENSFNNKRFFFEQFVYSKKTMLYITTCIFILFRNVQYNTFLLNFMPQSLFHFRRQNFTYFLKILQCHYIEYNLEETHFFVYRKNIRHLLNDKILHLENFFMRTYRMSCSLSHFCQKKTKYISEIT